MYLARRALGRIKGGASKIQILSALIRHAFHCRSLLLGSLEGDSESFDFLVKQCHLVLAGLRILFSTLDRVLEA